MQAERTPADANFVQMWQGFPSGQGYPSGLAFPSAPGFLSGGGCANVPGFLSGPGYSIQPENKKARKKREEAERKARYNDNPQSLEEADPTKLVKYPASVSRGGSW